MVSFDLKIKKVKSYNNMRKQHGYITRAVNNGTVSFESVAAEAAKNTTINKYELQAAMNIAAEEFTEALKRGFAVDLGPLGKLTPTVTSKWTETPEEQKKGDLKPNVRYDASLEIKEAMAGCRLTWIKPTEEEVEEEIVEEETTEEGGNTSEGGSNQDWDV